MQWRKKDVQERKWDGVGEQEEGESEKPAMTLMTHTTSYVLTWVTSKYGYATFKLIYILMSFYHYDMRVESLYRTKEKKKKTHTPQRPNGGIGTKMLTPSPAECKYMSK